MIKFPGLERINLLKKQYPEGSRIQIISLENEEEHIKPGDKGTVTRIDDLGQIHVNWDNGSSLALHSELDRYKIVP